MRSTKLFLLSFLLLGILSPSKLLAQQGSYLYNPEKVIAPNLFFYFEPAVFSKSLFFNIFKNKRTLVETTEATFRNPFKPLSIDNYDVSGGVPTYSEGYRNTYNAFGKIIRIILVKSQKTLFSAHITYDSDGTPLTYKNYKLNTANANDSFLFKSITYSTDANKRVIGGLIEPGDPFEDDDVYTLQYDANGNITEIETKVIKSGVPTPFEKDNYTYDNSGAVSTITRSFYDNGYQVLVEGKNLPHNGGDTVDHKLLVFYGTDSLFAVYLKGTAGIDRPTPLVATSTSIYPNPAHGTVTIAAPRGITISEVRIISLSGALLSTHRASGNSTTISTEGIPSGLYIIAMLDKDRLVDTQKLAVD